MIERLIYLLAQIFGWQHPKGDRWWDTVIKLVPLTTNAGIILPFWTSGFL